MKGAFLDCPHCGKKLAKDVWLRNGSRLTMRCYFCGIIVVINSDAGNITLTKVVPKGYIDRVSKEGPFTPGENDPDNSNGVVFFGS